jgi:hypothetical protein
MRVRRRSAEECTKTDIVAGQENRRDANPHQTLLDPVCRSTAIANKGRQRRPTVNVEIPVRLKMTLDDVGNGLDLVIVHQQSIKQLFEAVDRSARKFQRRQKKRKEPLGMVKSRGGRIGRELARRETGQMRPLAKQRERMALSFAVVSFHEQGLPVSPGRVEPVLDGRKHSVCPDGQLDDGLAWRQTTSKPVDCSQLHGTFGRRHSVVRGEPAVQRPARVLVTKHLRGEFIQHRCKNVLTLDVAEAFSLSDKRSQFPRASGFSVGKDPDYRRADANALAFHLSRLPDCASCQVHR